MRACIGSTARASSARSMSTAARVPFVSDRPVVTTTTRYTGTALDFVGTDGGGHSIMFSAGKGDGVSPMKTLLMALASCALTDVVMILQKQRVPIVDLRCVVDGQRAAAGARPWERVHMRFTLETPHSVSDESFARTLELSIDKYCGVHATMAPATAITYDGTVVVKH